MVLQPCFTNLAASDFVVVMPIVSRLLCEVFKGIGPPEICNKQLHQHKVYVKKNMNMKSFAEMKCHQISVWNNSFGMWWNRRFWSWMCNWQICSKCMMPCHQAIQNVWPVFTAVLKAKRELRCICMASTSRSISQGLQIITDYRRPFTTANMDPLLVNDLNVF